MMLSVFALVVASLSIAVAVAAAVPANIVDTLPSFIVNGDEAVVVGPRCIPLKSKNPLANPYHPALLSRPGAEVRRGLGLPTILPINGVDCPDDTVEKCTLTIAKALSFTVADSYTIGAGTARAFSKSLADTTSHSQGNAYTKSIGKTLERSLSKSLTLTDERSVADHVSSSIQRTHEQSSGITNTRHQETSDTNTITQDVSATDTLTNEIAFTDSLSREFGQVKSSGGSKANTHQTGSESSSSHTKESSDTVGGSVEASASFFGIGGSASASYSATSGESKTQSSSHSQSVSNTDEANWNNQFSNSMGASSSASRSAASARAFSVGNGKSNARTYTLGSSSSLDSRTSDSIAVSREAGRTDTRSHSSARQTGETNTESYRVDDSYTSNTETSFSKATTTGQEESVSNNVEVSQSSSYTVTVSHEVSFSIAPGACKLAVCYPYVVAVALPFECIGEEEELEDDDGDEEDELEARQKRRRHDIIYANYMSIDRRAQPSSNLTCSYSLIDCDQRDNYAHLFVPDNGEFKRANEDNSFEYGERAGRDTLLARSTNNKFTLRLLANGALELRQHNTLVWSNGMGFFADAARFEQVRLRINEKGHLVEEIKGELFAAVPGHLRRDEWVSVWSSAPIQHNTTIGIPVSARDAPISYKLVLENSGELAMYDAAGVRIWCTGGSCKHRNGYKWPEVYRVPTVFETPAEPADKHNSLDTRRVSLKRNTSSLVSIDASCSARLEQSTALVSPNGRFKLVLDTTGNLLIKDGQRTMWESASGHLPFARAPFRLRLTPSGTLVVVDAGDTIVWTTILVGGGGNATEEPKRRLVVSDAAGTLVWHSWPFVLNDESEDRDATTRTRASPALAATMFRPISYRYVPCDGYEKASLCLQSHDEDEHDEGEVAFRCN